MALRMNFSGTDDMIRAVRASGTTHYFSPDTMRFFKCRVGATLYGRRVFVTSERPSWDDARRYTVRVLCDNDGSYSVVTVGGFGAYATGAAAGNAARRVARALPDHNDYLDHDECAAIAVQANVRTNGGW
jgi:hypothetical protein